MGTGTKLAMGVGASAGLAGMMPFLIPIILIICCCSFSMIFPVSFSSSVLFGDVRGSKSFQKAKEHFEEKSKPNRLNQIY